MPPNTKGGKGYKKKKKASSQGNREIVYIVPEAGQMPARALKMLGNRQVLCYCNDDIIRNCHICGRMKGKQYVNIGDVLLVTLRDWSANVPQKGIKLGDIIDIYSREQYSSLRKDPAVNNRLLMQLELSNGYTTESLGEDFSKAVINMPEDDGIEFDSAEEDEEGKEDTQIVGAPANEKDIHLDDL